VGEQDGVNILSCDYFFCQNLSLTHITRTYFDSFSFNIQALKLFAQGYEDRVSLKKTIA
jgi:hypothetical protein